MGVCCVPDVGAQPDLQGLDKGDLHNEVVVVEVARRGERDVVFPAEKEGVGQGVALYGDLPRVEPFARERMSGLDVWSNEVECDFEFPALLSG